MKRLERILLVHNAYQLRGGEDGVVDAEEALLRQRGHDVLRYQRSNHDVAHLSGMEVLLQTFWSSRTVQDLRALVKEFQPDVVHVHNTFPLISPSVYSVAQELGLPVVQTLHNFRWLCIQGMFLRDGKSCEDCLNRVPWRAVLRSCYRGSRPASAVAATMTFGHQLAGTWSQRVSRYIALTEFSKSKFVFAGLPEARIHVKPNFVDLQSKSHGTRGGLLFVGRLSHEKGVSVLAKAAQLIGDGAAIRVIGDGPARSELEAVPGIEWWGERPSSDVFDAMREAACLILPSICYENFPRTLVEAYACGLPVIASRLGSMQELVEEGRTGLLFEPGNAVDLARAMVWAMAHPTAMQTMGETARQVYEERYGADRNYEQLMQIYREAIETQKGRIP